MLSEKLYTVADVAQVTGLTDRTIRNYLKEGVLSGQKIGVQWRFTEEDIKKLFSKQIPQQSTPSQLVRSFMGDFAKEENTCMIIEIECGDARTATVEFQRLQGCCEKKNLGIQLSYEYFEEPHRLRVAATGQIQDVAVWMEDLGCVS